MPIITLTTDFGLRDSYVAQMKGELLSRAPAGAQLVDLTHSLPAQGVREAALFLRFAVPRFPEGTVHLAVIDPGVGGARRAIALRSGGQLLVGPDNGIFGWLPEPCDAAVELDGARLGLAEPSPTFHGRDLFAPAAAALASGCPLDELGLPCSPGEPLRWPQPELAAGRIAGEVVHVDRFGNLISNIPRAALERLDSPQVAVGGHAVGAVVATYADAPEGEAVALFGSEDLLEVAVRDGHAARHFQLGVGATVVAEA